MDLGWNAKVNPKTIVVTLFLEELRATLKFVGTLNGYGLDF